MNKTVLMTTAAALIGLTTFVGVNQALSQADKTQAPSGMVAQDDVPDIKALAQQGERLKADTEAALKQFDKMQGILEKSSGNALLARQNVEDMIKLLRAAADRLGPEGSYGKTLKHYEEFVRTQAVEAQGSQNSGDRLYGDQLAKQAATIASLRDEAGSLATQLTAQIDRINQIKSQLTYATIIHNTDEFIKTARAYLDTARNLLTGTTELATKGERIAAPTLPTQ